MRLWALAFLSGILYTQQLSRLPSFYFFSLVTLSLIIFVPRKWRFNYSWLFILVSGVAFGFSWSLGHAHLLMQQQLQPQYEGVDIILEGQVVSLPIQQKKYSRKKDRKHFSQQRLRFDFTPAKIISPHNLILKNFPSRMRLTWYRPSSKVQAGETWRFVVRLKRPYALMNPGGFDSERYLFQKRIQARGYIRDSDFNKQLNNNKFSASKIILKFRQQILNKLVLLENNSELQNIRSLTQALILGYRGGIDASQWLTFQRTGTIHLMAISGLHIGLIAGLVYALVSLLWRALGVGCVRFAAPQVAAVAALIAAAGYAMLAGFTIPTQRALVMLSVAMLHIVFNRSPFPASTTIAIAGVLVLLLDPLAILAQGFWLSFFAVSIIIYVMRQSLYLKIEPEVIEQQKTFQIINLLTIKKALFQFSRIQWVLTLAMLPLVLYFYQSSSLVSPLANFIAIPVMSVTVVPLMFFATLFLFLHESVANVIFFLIDIIYGLLWQFLESLSQLSFATLESSAPSIWILLLCYVALFLWLLIKGSPMRWLAIIFLLPIIFTSKQTLSQGEAKVTVLDVGQGLSVVVQTKEHTVVFDTGPKYSQNFDTGRVVVAPYLLNEGRSVIDTLIISHGDNDHLGGFESVMALLTVKQVLTSIPKHTVLSNHAASACLAGQQWEYDGVYFHIMSPGSLTTTENGHDENNLSCVLKVSTQYGRVLLTGDIERETESYLYHLNRKNLTAEVLIVPHHGSNTSSLPQFIQAVKPNYAVFTVGYKNRYKLPSKHVISRYKRFSQAELINSSQSGAVSFRLMADHPIIAQRYREDVRRYWHTVVSE